MTGSSNLSQWKKRRGLAGNFIYSTILSMHLLCSKHCCRCNGYTKLRNYFFLKNHCHCEERYTTNKINHYIYTYICIYIKYTIIRNIYRVSQAAAVVKNLPANAGDPGDAVLIPGSGRSSGERNSNALQYSCLKNLMDRGTWWTIAHGLAKSLTQLSTHEHWAHICKCIYTNIILGSVEWSKGN